MKYYFKRRWDEERWEVNENWGESLWYFETNSKGLPLRQIEKYDNGIIMKYSEKNLQSKYGGLGDQELDLVEFKEFEISQQEFLIEWNK